MTNSSVVSLAGADDIPRIKSMVDAAYGKYTERIGKPAAPMSMEYDSLVSSHSVFVLHDEDAAGAHRTIGAIVLRADKESRTVKVNSVVVDPSAQGRGYGRVLMDFAEEHARKNHCDSLTLYTNVNMYENLGLYAKLGYSETGRREEDGYERVFFRKDVKNPANHLE